MPRPAQAITTALALALLALTPTALAQPTAQPIGFSVGAAALEDMPMELKPNGLQAGTRVHVLVSGVDQPIVLVDDDASEITAFTDSTGKNLLDKPEKKQSGFTFSFGGSDAGVGPFPQIAEDGKQATVELIAPVPPAPDAESISVEATLVLKTAASTRTLTTDPLAIGSGKASLDGDAIRVQSLEPSQFQPGTHELTLVMPAATLEKIKAIKALATDGTVLAEDRTSTMTMNNTSHVGLMLSQKVGKVVLEIEAYEQMAITQVPVNVTLGLGLPGE